MRKLLLLLFFPAAALAQGWPQQPITILMGFPAGSGVDVVARLLEEPMSKSLGAKLVMDYRVGAGGNLASEAVARAKPDGYTILFGTAATHGVNAALYKKLPFDVEADFTPIAPMVNVSNVLTVNPDVIDASTLREFIDKVKANPGKYNYASTGNGTGTHLAFAEFVSKAGLDMVHVPYKGGPEALTSVVSGTTCCIFNQVQTVIPQWKAGQGAAAGRHHAHARVGGAGRADHRGSRAAGLRELHLVRPVRAEGPGRRDRQQGERGGEVRARAACGARPAGAARQHAALGIARAVPRHGEGRPRQVGGGGQGDRRDDRLMPSFPPAGTRFTK